MRQPAALGSIVELAPVQIKSPHLVVADEQVERLPCCRLAYHQRRRAEDLLKSLNAVPAGRQWIDPAAARVALDAAVQPGVMAGTALLTSRETEILRLIARGQRNKEVARHLGITEGMVKMHLHRIYEKLSVKNRTELSALARDKRLI